MYEYNIPFVLDTNVVIYLYLKGVIPKHRVISGLLSEIRTKVDYSYYLKLKYIVYEDHEINKDCTLLNFAIKYNYGIYTFDRALIKLAKTKRVIAITPRLSQIMYD